MKGHIVYHISVIQKTNYKGNIFEWHKVTWAVTY